MNKKLILILIIILIILSLCYNNTSINYISEALTIQKVGDNYEDPNAGENFQENILDNTSIIITSDKNYYYLNIEDKSNIVYTKNINDKNNKWLPKKYNIIKIKNV